MKPTIRLTNDQRAQRRRAAQGAFRLVRLLPAIPSLHLSRTGSQKFATPLASGGVGNVYFGVALSRESDDRLEAKIDRLLSEEEAGVQAKA